MQHPFTSMPHGIGGHDMNLNCTLLLTCNSLMGWMSSMSMVQWLQVMGIIMSMVASFYVSYNQHLNVRWKKRQDRDSGGAYVKPPVKKPVIKKLQKRVK